MHKVSLAALALSAAITTQAHANYVWQFVPSHVTAMNIDGYGGYVPAGIPSKETKTWVPDFRIEVTNAAFASRALSLNWAGCMGGGYCSSGPTGDFSKLASFIDFYSGSTDSLYGYGDVELSWTKRGKLTGSIDLAGMLSDLTLTGLGTNRWEGRYGSDNSECGMEVAWCEITGHFAFLGDPPAGGDPVPEPASIAMLAIGLLGAGAARKMV